MRTITRNINTHDGQQQAENKVKKMIVQISKANPTKHITHTVRWGAQDGEFIVEIHIHNRKPQSINTAGAENTFRRFGGFFKNGKVISPSNTFIKRFNSCPVSR